MNIAPVLHEVNRNRRRENYTNVLKFMGVLLLVLTLGTVAAVLANPEKSTETLFVSGALWLFATIFFVISFACTLWPFLLYWWGNVQTIRQRMLLSLVQSSVETNTPLQHIIRSYASTCCSRYAKRLERFAATLDAGKSLEEAVHVHWGLFRYDVAGILRFGGNDPDTLRSLEMVAQDERDFSVIKTHTLIRVVYLCTVVGVMLGVTFFMFVHIVPEFEKIFEEFDVRMPAMTTFIIGIAAFCNVHWYLGVPLLGLIALVLFTYLILQTDCIVFRPWGLRYMFRNTDSAKFLMVFAAGIRRGFPIPAILRMYNWTVPSIYLRHKGMAIRTAVENGGDWIDAMGKSGFVNKPEVSLLRSAQRTGNTAVVLDQLALSKERSQKRRDDLISKLVFIPLVFLLGSIVGAFVIGMYLPLIALIMSQI